MTTSLRPTLDTFRSSPRPRPRPARPPSAILVALFLGALSMMAVGSAPSLGQSPRDVSPERLVHPDERSSPTITGSGASFRAVTELRDLSRRASEAIPGRAHWADDARATLASVDDVVVAWLTQECDPLEVAETTSRAVARLDAVLSESGPLGGRSRDARVARELREIRRSLTDGSREVLLSTLQWLSRSEGFRDRLPNARETMIEADALYEAGNWSGAAAGYRDALSMLTFECVLDLEALEAGLSTEGSTVSVGHAYAIGRFGSLVASGAGGQARLPQSPPSKPMTPQTKVNTASTAKVLTTIAALRLLTSRGIGLDDPIGPYLPEPWDTNPYFDQITFRRLMTHTSGIGGGNQWMADGWEQLKEAALAFVWPLPQVQYENVNLGLFRALIPEILGFPTEILAPGNAGLFAGTIYADWVDDAVLSPSGVNTALCNDPESPPTLYYPGFAQNADGWFPGDLRYFCGGGGWSLSAEDWIAILGATRYGGLLSGAEKAELYGTPLAWWPRLRSYGTVYLHNGALISPQGGVRTCIGDFPQGWQVAFLLNQNVPFQNAGSVYDACTAVIDAFDAAWTPVPQ